MKKINLLAVAFMFLLSSCALTQHMSSPEVEIITRIVTADEIWMSYDGKTYVVHSWKEFAEKAMELMSQKQK